ncbi:DUF3179 domain-containing (seleno)protein [Desulfoluna spongiiphila]|uniref:DUF3179 domain-containing protein n=1 Tax=Desulfoluna spongiiphila TaxID=419481 RepID=A0A1G5H477_9BACT|nr:Protein of unknown function [Desulfoluna spongiiphila]
MATNGKKWILVLALLLCSAWGWAAPVERNGDRVWIVDRMGERWEVTDAEKLGFEPERFQYGIGRDAIVPLDEGAFSRAPSGLWGGTRVIGFGAEDDARAVSVDILTRHEILNTALAGASVAAAY